MQVPRASFTGTLHYAAERRQGVAGGRNQQRQRHSNSRNLRSRWGTFTLGGSHMAVGRYQHTATLLPNGDVLIAVGTSSFGSDNNNAEIYLAANGTFSPLIPMTSTHTGGTATLLPNGKVLIAGGLTLVPIGTSIRRDRYHHGGTVRSFKQHIHRDRADAHCPLFPHRGSPTERQSAGSWRNECPNIDEGSAELYDPTAGTFTTTGSMTPRSNAAAAVLPTEKFWSNWRRRASTQRRPTV